MEGARGRECQTLHSPPSPTPWCPCLHLDLATAPAHHLSSQDPPTPPAFSALASLRLLANFYPSFSLLGPLPNKAPD